MKVDNGYQTLSRDEGVVGDQNDENIKESMQS